MQADSLPVELPGKPYVAVDNQNKQVTGWVPPDTHTPAPWSLLHPSGFPGGRIANLVMIPKQPKRQRYQITKPDIQSLPEDGQSIGTRQRGTAERKHRYPIF